jgi:predicted NAD/FAD-binding protein
VEECGVTHTRGLDIAVIGSGIAGLSCAWLLGRAHRVTVYEAAHRVGGHGCTLELQRPGGPVPVDIGFIVYNEPTYPNLTALFRHLGVPTQPSCMSLGISLDGGGFEYGGHDIGSLFAQRRNLIRPRFWAMLWELMRLYRIAPGGQPDDHETLGAWLDRHKISAALQRDHLLPMAAAIWSCPPEAIRAQPAAAFLRFCDNHGLLRLRDRPEWRTVTGGSREYVWRLLADFSGRMETGREVVSISRAPDRVVVRDALGDSRGFDHVVIATHGDQAYSMIADKDDEEREILGTFHCVPNRAVLHGDATLMPRRRAVWSSWNFLARASDPTEPPCVTYWMNRLQNLPQPNLFLTLNPRREPAPGLVFAEHPFAHPVFDIASLASQKKIWALQGRRRIFFCGAYLGAGFHEDGLQAGLAIAEALGGVRRPWRVPGESARLHIPAGAMLAVPA